MPNFGAMGLRGLMGAGAMLGAAERGIARFGLSGAGRYLASNAGRTIAGAGLGALYGGSGENGSFGGAIMGAAAGAGLGRYGGAFMRAGMTRGMGISGAGQIASALVRSDGRRAARFIGTTAMNANRGLGKIRGLFR